jgi:hypothetical protein
MLSLLSDVPRLRVIRLFSPSTWESCEELDAGGGATSELSGGRSPSSDQLDAPAGSRAVCTSDASDSLAMQNMQKPAVAGTPPYTRGLHLMDFHKIGVLFGVPGWSKCRDEVSRAVNERGQSRLHMQSAIGGRGGRSRGGRGGRGGKDGRGSRTANDTWATSAV